MIKCAPNPRKTDQEKQAEEKRKLQARFQSIKFPLGEIAEENGGEKQKWRKIHKENIVENEKSPRNNSISVCLNQERGKNKQLRNQLQKQQDLIRDLKEKLGNCISQKEKVTELFNQAVCENTKLKDEFKQKKLLQLQYQLDYKTKKNHELILSNRLLKDKNKNLQEEQGLKVYRAQIKKLEERGFQQDLKIQSLKQEVNTLNLQADIPEMIHYLLKKMNFDTVSKFKNLYLLVQSYNGLLNNARKLNKNIDQAPSVYYGYLNQREDGSFFAEVLNNQKYDIVACNIRIQKELIDQAPCQIEVLSEHQSVLVEIYDNDQPDCLNLPKIKLSPSKSTVPNSYRDQILKRGYYRFPQSFKVLIVGSQHKETYLKWLRRANLTATWFDPYEKNVINLSEKIKAADAVIICTSHISHAVFGQIDKNNPKVELIEKDSVTHLIYRIRYRLIRLGLLTTGIK